MTDELIPDKKSQYIALIQKYIYQFFLIVIILVFVVISFVAYHFVLLPKYGNINNEIKKSIEARTDNKVLLERYLQRLNKYKEKYDNIPKLDKENVSAFFNYDYDSEILFSQFEAIANSQELILNSISIQTEVNAKKKSRAKEKISKEAQGGLKTVKINAIFSGLNYMTLKNFLDFFENTLPLINITNLDFADDDAVSIDAETYYLN